MKILMEKRRKTLRIKEKYRKIKEKKTDKRA